MQLRKATKADIAEILALHSRYHIDAVHEQDRANGFIATAFTEQQLQQLIDDEDGIFIALQDGRIVAYVMSASWEFWSQWPIFRHMIKDLPTLTFNGVALSTENSYQYGPVCVDTEARGSGVFERLFDFAAEHMSQRFEYMVTFVNKLNKRSYQAHTRKAGMQLVHEFEFSGGQYYELVRATAPALP